MAQFRVEFVHKDAMEGGRGTTAGIKTSLRKGARAKPRQASVAKRR